MAQGVATEACYTKQIEPFFYIRTAQSLVEWAAQSFLARLSLCAKTSRHS